MKINDIRVLINPASTFDEKVNASLRLRFDGEEMTTIKGLAETNGTEFDIAMQDMGKKYSTSVTTREAESYQVSRATKYFRIAEIVVRALNVLMMGFMTVMAAVEISKEAKSGGYSTSVCLEIVSTSLMALSCICEAVVFVGDLVGMACSVLPAIGAVAALIGIVFQIVAGALRKPVNPLAEFIKNVLVPFLNSLVIPGRDWVEAHGKQLQTA